MTALYLSALLLGLGGSLHCLGMCGPLVMGMPFQQLAPHNKPGALLTYSVSKALAYGGMGVLMGLLGKGFELMNWQQVLSVIAGAIIILIALMPQILKRVHTNFFFQKQFAAVYASIQQNPSLKHFGILGFLNGLLPCGLVYTALAGSAVAASAGGGFLFMFLFGIGTAPALVALVLLKNKLSLNFRRNFARLSLVFSLLIGGLLIARGMNLGIPGVSPEFTKGKVHNCCSKKAH
ncbi:MAG: sulfite exporter TauE/SafE family protein [Ferruginibacter sp.]